MAQPPGTPTEGECKASLVARQEYIATLLAEIRILIRSIANDPSKRLSSLSVDWKENETLKRYSYSEVVARLADADCNPEPATLLTRIGLLQAVKDALIEMTQPATGLTVAYTALLIASGDETETESTYALAKKAYPGLEVGAKRHRTFIRQLGGAAMILAVFATWEATHASLGRSLLQVLEPLRVQQAELSAAKQALESDLEKHPTPVAADLLPLCDRQLLVDSKLPTDAAQRITGAQATTGDKILLAESAHIRDLCGRDSNLRASFKLAHFNLRLYRTSWTSIAGGIYRAIGLPMDVIASHISQFATGWLSASQPAPNPIELARLDPAACAEAPAPPVTPPVILIGGPAGMNADRPRGPPGPEAAAFMTCGDEELLVAPFVQVISSFTLPFAFGVLGSLLFVLVHHFASLRTSTLAPRDRSLAKLRVILGIVVAACISLIITGYTNPGPLGPLPGSATITASTLTSAFSFSISGITFLAGFGAEAVFSLLQQLVERVFSMPK